MEDRSWRRNAVPITPSIYIFDNVAGRPFGIIALDLVNWSREAARPKWYDIGHLQRTG